MPFFNREREGEREGGVEEVNRVRYIQFGNFEICYSNYIYFFKPFLKKIIKQTKQIGSHEIHWKITWIHPCARLF